jgi:hypothetical protein
MNSKPQRNDDRTNGYTHSNESLNHGSFHHRLRLARRR